MSDGIAASQRSESTARNKPAPAGAQVMASVRAQPAAVRRMPQPSAAEVNPARTFGLLGISVGAHMAIMGVLGFMPHTLVPAAQQVEMEVMAPEPEPPPPPPPPPEPPPETAPPQHPKAAPKLAAPKPAAAPPPQAAPQPVAEAPVDLTGVTLTGSDGSWSSVVGNGAALAGPAPRIAKVTGHDRPGAPAPRPVVQRPAMVSAASLSRPPVPPDGDSMNTLLLQNYPSRARAQGVAGSAQLRVQILADGQVGDMHVLRETGDYGFGTACMKTLRVRRWQPPLDRRGAPVATEVRYTCDFEVAD